MPRPMLITIFFIFALCTLGIYIFPLMHLPRLNAYDWEYFNGLSYVVKSSFLGYNTLPVHNPWSCGGLDLLTNPQNRIFSPFVLADLIFYPPFSNLIPFMVLTFLGLCGGFLLFRKLNVSVKLSVIGAILFINSTWFGLHFAEGHITFGSMQLLPLALYFGLRLKDSPRYFLYLSLLFCYFILDGGVYTLFFSFLLILSTYAVQFQKFLKTIRIYIANHSGLVLFLCMTSLLICAPKVLPTFFFPPSILSYTTHDYSIVMPFSIWFNAFLNPLQQPGFNSDEMWPFRFHEFGTYLSPLALLLILSVIFWRRDFFVRNAKYVFLAVFWFWIATGIFPSINLWQFLEYVPFFNRLHLQSRTLILCFLFFVLLTVKSLDLLLKRYRIPAYVLVALLLAESFFVRIHSNYDFGTRSLFLDQPIQSTTIDRTVRYSRIAEHYQAVNTGSARCYEPSFSPKNINYTWNTLYKGEAYSIPDHTWFTNLKTYTPGFIEIEFKKLKEDGIIRLNTNALQGWKVLSHNAEILGSDKHNLDIIPLKNAGIIVLEYDPWYLDWSLGSFGAGVIFLVGFVVFRRKIPYLKQIH